MNAHCGAVDVGGTKMLAQRFDKHMNVLDERQVPTPATDYEPFLAQLTQLLEWLGKDLPLGVSIAGFIDPATGKGVASNLPITGKVLTDDLAERLKSRPSIINDCNAFALSEAVDGAGVGARVMVGLIIGTGMAAGLCENGRLATRGHAQAIEIGHVGIPLRTANAFGLDLLPCGCGLEGCFERYIAGPGLTAFAQKQIGQPLTGETLAKGLQDNDPDAKRFFVDWCELVAEALSVIHMMNDPEVIVLGGGLSNLPGLIPALTDAFARHALPATPRPELRLAQHGGTSGTRGAGFIALQEANKC